MVPGDAGEGGRGELDEGAGVCSPDQLDPLHVTVEGENVVQEIWLTHVLKITGCIKQQTNICRSYPMNLKDYLPK